MLQIIAMITMLIDHLGVIYEISWFRIIGRVAMPVYAFLICDSFRHTTNKKRYIRRLFTISIISQLVFCRALNIDEFKLNVCFVWCFSVLWLMMYENKDKLLPVLTGIYVVFAIAVNIDYGFIGFGWVLLWFFKDKMKTPLKMACLMALCFTNVIQAFSIVAFPIVNYFSKHDNIRCKNKTFKYIYRWFYPAHLAVLRGLRC